MNIEETSFTPRSPHFVWLGRWALSAVSLAAGLIILSGPAQETGLSWIRVGFYHNGLSVPFPSRFVFVAVLISSIAAAVALGWRTYRYELRRTLADSGVGDARWTYWLLVYLVMVVGLADLIKSDTGGALTAIHALKVASLGLVALISWCLAAMPRRFWLSCITRRPTALMVATAVGVVTYTIGHHYTNALFGLLNPLERATLWTTSILLRLFVKDIIVDPKNSLIGTSSFAVYIAGPCSGLEGIALFSVFFSVYLWIFRSEFHIPQALLLLPIGVAVLFFLNAVRLVVLILLGEWSDSLAIQGFHSVAGWLFFNAVTLGLVAASRHFMCFAKTAPLCNLPGTPNPAAPYLAPILTIIGAATISRIFLFKFDVLYPLRTTFAAGVLWLYRKNVPLRWTISRPTVALGCLAFGVWILLVGQNSAPARDVAVAAGLGGLSTMAGSLWIALRVAGAVAVVPIAEELAFRGYLIRKLVSADFEKVALGHFTWVSFLGSSILFGSLHAQWIAGTLVGMIFALAICRRGLMSDAILAHATTNGLLTAYILMTGRWSLWD